MKIGSFNCVSKQILFAYAFYTILLCVGIFISSSAQSNAVDPVYTGTVSASFEETWASIMRIIEDQGGAIEKVEKRDGVIITKPSRRGNWLKGYWVKYDVRVTGRNNETSPVELRVELYQSDNCYTCLKPWRKRKSTTMKLEKLVDEFYSELGEQLQRGEGMQEGNAKNIEWSRKVASNLGGEVKQDQGVVHKKNKDALRDNPQTANAIKFGTINFGPYTSAMSLEEAKKIAGGEIKCGRKYGGSAIAAQRLMMGLDNSRAKPKEITCTLEVTTGKREDYFTIVKGALTGEILSMKRNTPVPIGMLRENVQTQVFDKWVAKYGKPNVRRYCSDWCWSNNRNMPDEQLLRIQYNTHWSIPFVVSEWTDRAAKKRNEARFDKEWIEYERQLKETAPKPKLDL